MRYQYNSLCVIKLEIAFAGQLDAASLLIHSAKHSVEKTCLFLIIDVFNQSYKTVNVLKILLIYMKIQL